MPTRSAWIRRRCGATSTAWWRAWSRPGWSTTVQFAASRARRLLAAGRSPARIRASLAAKGLDGPAIAAALRDLTDELADPELAAAAAYARRRRLGPWGPMATRADHKAKDLAALGRAGFGYQAARRVVEAVDIEALEREVGAGPRR